MSTSSPIQFDATTQQQLETMTAAVQSNIQNSMAALTPGAGTIPASGATTAPSGSTWKLGSLIDPDLMKIIEAYPQQWNFQSFVVGVQNIRLQRQILAALQSVIPTTTPNPSTTTTLPLPTTTTPNPTPPTITG
jgi:hypothetical protein